MITQQNNYCLYKKLRNDMELVYYIYLHGEKGHTWNESTIAFNVSFDVGHCLSLALATNKMTVFPFAVAFAMLCEPVNANGVSKTYL